MVFHEKVEISLLYTAYRAKNNHFSYFSHFSYFLRSLTETLAGPTPTSHNRIDDSSEPGPGKSVKSMKSVKSCNFEPETLSIPIQSQCFDTKTNDFLSKTNDLPTSATKKWLFMGRHHCKLQQCLNQKSYFFSGFH